MKRTLSLVLALVMVLGSFTTVFAAEEATNAVAEFLNKEGVLLGNEDGDLELDKDLERRNAVVLLSRLLGVEEEAAEFEAEGYPTWEDVDADPYYDGYLAWAEVNEYFQGDDEGNFNPRNPITAQEFAVVLLRALDAEVEWDEVMDKAEELGLFAGVEVEGKDAVVRGQMANMIFNALIAEDGKLAEKLGIELPEAPAPEALEVISVTADNLKQVVVEFNQEVDEKTAENKDNYTLDLAVETIVLQEDGKTVVITLDKNEAVKFEMQKEYELKIANVENAEKTQKFTSTTFKFRPVDVTVPYVKEVTALGTKAIKVVFSEPVQASAAGSTTSYKIDGKFVAGVAKYVFPNEVIITTNVAVGEHTLAVTGVKDFNNYAVQETGFAFTVVEDTDAPEIVSAHSIDLNKAVVEFNEPVKAVASAYHTAKANGATISISGNKVTLTFTNKMGLGATTLFLNGVQDYSDNKADRTVVITPELDMTRPEIVEVEVLKGKDFTVTYNKELDEDTAKNSANYTVKKADGTVVKGYGLNNDGNPVVTRTYDNDKKTVKFSLVTALPEGSYVLEVSGIRDKATIANVMLPEAHAFEVGDTKALTVNKAWTAATEKADNSLDLFIQFNKNIAVDGTGNALEVSKYNYVESAPGYALKVFPNATTIELVAEDTVKLRLPKADAAYDVAKVRVTRVSDNNKNFITDARFDVNSTLTVAIDKVHAIATNKIEVTFKGQLNVVISDFSVAKDAYNKADLVELSVTEKDGNTVATFTLDADTKLPEGPVGYKLTTKANAADIASIDNWNNKLVANADIEVVDKIKPTVDTVTATAGTSVVKVKFNEVINVGNLTSVIKAEVVGRTVTVDSLGGNGTNTLEITLVIKDADGGIVQLAANDVITIELLEANNTVKAIADTATPANAPAPFQKALTVTE